MNRRKRKEMESSTPLTLFSEVSLLEDCCAVHRVTTDPSYLHAHLKSSARIDPPKRNHFLISQGGACAHLGKLQSDLDPDGSKW